MSTQDREDAIRRQLAQMPPMSDVALRAQRESFAYGNLKVDEPLATRAMIAAIVRRT